MHSVTLVSGIMSWPKATTWSLVELRLKLRMQAMNKIHHLVSIQVAQALPTTPFLLGSLRSLSLTIGIIA